LQQVLQQVLHPLQQTVFPLLFELLIYGSLMLDP
jgi:hypothetical protein